MHINRTIKDIKTIIAKSSSLFERLSNQNQHNMLNSFYFDEKLADKRLDYWCKLLTDGDWSKFRKRLEWDGLELKKVRFILGAKKFEVQYVPMWSETLLKIIEAAQKMDSSNPIKLTSKYQKKNSLPFEHILMPAIIVAGQILHKRVDMALFIPQLISKTAYLNLEWNLLKRLVNISAKTLFAEFSKFRPAGYFLLGSLVEKTTKSSNKGYYNSFLQKNLNEGLLNFFIKYPVLAKLIATQVDYWVKNTSDFLLRLNNDLSEIKDVFTNSENIGKVINIEPNLSDLHDNAQHVISLKFESGLEILYKPRNLQIEIVFNNMLTWFNSNYIHLPFKITTVLNRKKYGWVENIDQLACNDSQAANRFYQRAGMLLCILYVLKGTDCHHENVIANGEHLVLVDIETLLHPEEIVNKENIPFNNSVLRIGLLPRWQITKDSNEVYDVSALGSIKPQKTPYIATDWKFINTDDMNPSHNAIILPVKKNVAILNQKPLSPNDYIDDIIAGFKDMYLFFIEHKKTLLALNSPLRKLNFQQLRFIHKPTHFYSFLIQRSLLPKYLMDGIDHSIELDVVCKFFLMKRKKPKSWSIFKSELRSMEQLDIPRFGFFSHNDELCFGVERPINKFFEESSFKNMISQLKNLNESDLAHQIVIVKSAFYAKNAKMHYDEALSRPNHYAEKDKIYSNSLLTPEELLIEAKKIADEINFHKIETTDESVNWVSLNYIKKIQRFQVQPIGNNLYDGKTGIAIFLSAYEYVTKDNSFNKLVLKSLRDLRKNLNTFDDKAQNMLSQGLGIGIGIGSLIYSLVKISYFLKNESFIEDAKKISELITSEAIKKDINLDIMSGSSGAIVGLLNLYKVDSDENILNKAIVCGQHLLNNRILFNGYKVWKSSREIVPLTGFSHGAAGISFALFHLYSLTKYEEFLLAAIEGISYERSVFSKVDRNWPDFREYPKLKFLNSWCHGAPGIALARLGGTKIYQSLDIQKDIDIGIQTTQSCDMQRMDHLCCGNFGRCEVLFVASNKLGQTKLKTEAEKKIAYIMARAKLTGGYRLPGSVFNPSFFNGISGIGYELLRIACPDLPSVLLWE